MNAIPLPPEFEKRIAEFAKLTGQSQESFVREILERGLEDVEDLIAANAVSSRVKNNEEVIFFVQTSER